MRHYGDVGTYVEDWTYLVLFSIARHFKADKMQDHRGVSLLAVIFQWFVIPSVSISSSILTVLVNVANKTILYIYESDEIKVAL